MNRIGNDWRMGMLRGMEGEGTKMASERRTDYGTAAEGSIGIAEIPGLSKRRSI